MCLYWSLSLGTRLHSRKWVVGERALNICIYSCSPITGITVWVPPPVQSVVGLDSHRTVNPTALESSPNHFHLLPMSAKTLSFTKPIPGAKNLGTVALHLPMQNSYDFSHFLDFLDNFPDIWEVLGQEKWEILVNMGRYMSGGLEAHLWGVAAFEFCYIM